MRCFRAVFLCGSAFCSCLTLAQQTSTTKAFAPPIARDAQAISIVRQAVAAMAAMPPSNSTATGTVTVVEGSRSQTGTVQIQTLGTGQTAETLTLPDGTRQVLYSNGAAKEVYGSRSTTVPLQAVLTDQCPDFPLPLLLSALANADEGFRYIGAESLKGVAVQHLEFWNSFASKPHLQDLAPFSLRELWVDSASGLPVKLGYSRRASGGMAPAFRVEVLFSNYTKVDGVLYPFEINKSMNGTHWQTITIQNVSFNTGLTVAQFPVQ